MDKKNLFSNDSTKSTIMGVVAFVIVLIARPFVYEATGLDIGSNWFRLLISTFVVCIPFMLYMSVRHNKRQGRLKEILKIKDPDERIRLIEEAMSSDLLISKTDEGKAEQTDVQLRISYINLLGMAYIAKGEYKTALTKYEEIAMLPYMLGGCANPNATDFELREQVMMSEAEALMHLGETIAAKSKLAPLMARLDKLSDINRTLLLIHNTMLEALGGNAAEARACYATVAAKIAHYSKYSKSIHYDGVLLEGFVLKSEGNTLEARQRFQDVADNADIIIASGGDVGVIRQAKAQLEQLRGQ
jgi:hypothetical protein